MTKRLFKWVVVVAILVSSFASVGGASAWSGCGSTMTVQWGDTLSGIAFHCGTTVAAIRAANPGLGWRLYAGQVLYMPAGTASVPVSYPTYGGTYIVQWGDTLGKIAARTGISVRALLAVNPQIWDPSLIYAGQVLNLPSGVSVPPPPIYNHPPGNPNCNCPPQPVDSFSSLKIDYKNGLFVRSTPGGTIIASAVNKSTWYYRQSSVFIDSKWKVWAEVKLFPPVKGYSTGWILVKDQLGKYFTDPPINK
ncbi:MAG TPA: LysM domain-containing protein [Anaerolineales bacterium]|nr:LysM domain-containing protein [Anaerolineales bacterium]